MKLTLVFIMVSMLSVSANSFAQKQKLSINMKNVKLAEIIWELQQNSNIVFVYKTSDLEHKGKVSIQKKQVSINEILDEVLKDKNIEYSIEDKVIILKKKRRPLEVHKEKLQEFKVRTITGKVIDCNQLPLPGVSVVIKGTTKGVSTDIDGNYTIKTEDKSGIILIFSFVGMKDKEIKIGKENVYDVFMCDDTENLSEVVVTGYQTISKERATGSFGSIKTEDFEKKINTNLMQSIEGLSTGLVQENGIINIRGVATFNATASPLIVVDGFPYQGTINDINPDNIENITILKDGVAASIYGSRSANGVIVITTKKARNKKLNINYKVTLSTAQKTNMHDVRKSSPSDYIDGQIGLYESYPSHFLYNPTPTRQSAVDYYLTQVNTGDLTKEEALKKIDAFRGNNAYSQIEKYGLNYKLEQQHNLSISGGGESNLFNATVRFIDTKGEEKLSKSNNLILDFNNIWTPLKNLKVTMGTNFIYKKSERSNVSLKYLISPHSIQPYDLLVDENGKNVDLPFYTNPLRNTMYSGVPGMKPTNYNPFDEMKNNMTNSSSMKTRIYGTIDLKLFKGLSVNFGGSWSRSDYLTSSLSNAKSYDARLAYNDATSRTNYTQHYFPEGGILDETRGIKQDYTIRTQLNYSNVFGKKHRVSALVGNEIRQDETNYAYLPTKVGYNETSGSFVFIDNHRYSDYNNPDKSDYVLGYYSHKARVSTGKMNFEDNRYTSWYGNGSYEFDNRFLISGSIRLDLTNFFGTDPKYRYKPLWSVGGTYKLSKEKWFSVEQINRLNLRASYGINGNISLNEGPFMILYNGGFDEMSQDIANTIKSPANNQLRWEKTTTTNLGIDVSAFNNKIALSVDVYKKYSTDLLSDVASDPTTGVSNLMKNAGIITNKGIEISLNTQLVKANSFVWTSTFNFSHNDNYVNKFDIKRDFIRDYLQTWGNRVNQTGYAMNPLWGFKAGPLDNKGFAQAYNKDGELVHPNKLGKEDVVYLGTQTPKTHVSFINKFNYKNFDLSFMFIGSFGAKFFEDSFTGDNIENRYVAKAWKKEGDEKHTIYPAISLTKESAGWYYNKAHYFVKSADYIKLRDITLTYTINNSLLEKLHIKKSRVFFQTRNLLLITAKGVDIDPSIKGMPQPIEFYGGLSLEF